MREEFSNNVDPVCGRDGMPIHNGDECLIHYPTNRAIHNKHGIAKIINDGESAIRVLVSLEKGGSTLLTANDISLTRTAQELAEESSTSRPKVSPKQLEMDEIKARLRAQESPRFIGVD